MPSLTASSAALRGLAPAWLGAAALLGAVLLGSCGGGEAAAPAHWSALRGDAYEVVEGEAALGRDSWVSRWYGQESPPPEEAQLLGDERAVLQVSTPSHLAVRLGAGGTGGARQFTAGLRRGLGGAEEPLRAELFWEAEGGGAMRSLGAVELDAGQEWREYARELPAEAGTLRLLVRYAHPALAAQAGPLVSWAAPEVRPLARSADGGTESGAGTQPGATRLPDVVLVTVDTLRSDALSPELMPWLHGVLARGKSWPRAVSPSNWTLPSYASLLTGLPAEAHGAGRADFPAQVGGRPDYTAVLPDLPTFVGRMAEAGYATCMVHQNPFLEPWTGLSADFERWVRVADAPLAGRAAAEGWWRAQEGRPRLLVLHYFAPHLPYAPESVAGISDALPADPLAELEVEDFLAGDHTPEERAQYFALEEPAREAVRTRYRAEAAVLDRRLQEWLQPWLEAGGEDLVFVMHADHGEELWDAGSFEHGHSFDDSVARVPLGIVWPGRVAPAEDPRPVPARLLGLELLRLLGLEDEALPSGDLAEGLPSQATCSHPLYRSAEGGRRWALDGSYEALPFTLTGSRGAAPVLSPEVERQLSALGYAGD